MPVGPDNPNNKLLVIGAALSGIAALLHLACLIVGAPMFRLLGAGEQMARLHLAGHWYPTVVTLAIASVLAAWSAFALSGAGVIRRLPLLRTALFAITSIYIVRGVAFLPVVEYFPGNSMTFWIASSSISLLIGVVHLVGLRQSWNRLSSGAAWQGGRAQVRSGDSQALPPVPVRCTMRLDSSDHPR